MVDRTNGVDVVSEVGCILANWKNQQMEKNSDSPADSNELLISVRRLTRIALDRLERGIQEGTLDEAQIRMLGSLAVRAIRLWHEARGNQPIRESAALLNAETELAETLSEAHRQRVEP